jgi:hypothetical protein
MLTEIEELHRRVDKIEKQKNEEVLALIEILSNATFFGEMKKLNCEYAKNGQCGFFILENDEKNKMPIITECRIGECQESYIHCHIELSNISCTLCQRIVIVPGMEGAKPALKKNSKNQGNTIHKINKARKQK